VKIPLISKFLRYKKRQYLRQVIRGYKHLKESNRLGLISSVKETLTNTRISQIEKNTSKRIFGAGLHDRELIIRQYLLMRLGGLNLNRALLYSLGNQNSSVIYPLPPAWRCVLREYGFKVPKVRTKLIWQAYVFLFFVNGLLYLVRQSLSNFKSIISRSERKFLGEYIYFDGIVEGCLPQASKDGISHDLLSWYLQWPGRIKDIDTLCHSVSTTREIELNSIQVTSIPSPILPLSKLTSVFFYFAWSIIVTLHAIYDFFLGHWWNIVLLKESSIAAIVRIEQPERLAREYLFNNSNWIYRPLWTYEAEKAGSKITFYFYSTNCESFKLADNYPNITYGWQAMNWPHYLVWDDYQKDFVNRAVGESAKVSIVGSIWFNTSSLKIPKLESKAIAIFDVTPFRTAHYVTMGAEIEFYTPDVCEKFLEDIQELASTLGYQVLWKRKRKIGMLAHPEAIYFNECYSNVANVMSIDSDISAYRVIESADIVVSMPYTSTAILARELGKPSCFYDPLGVIQQGDRAAHGIEVLSGKECLGNWFNIILNG